MPSQSESLAMTVEKLKHQIRQVLNGIISLHIDILVMEADVTQLIDEVKEINAELLEVNRLDKLIATLKNFNGPTIFHEWPYPPLSTGSDNLIEVDEAVIAIQGQTTNGENT